MTVTGLNTYVDNMVVNPAASGADAIALKDEVQTLVADMVTQPWPGAWHLGRTSGSRTELHFGLTGDTLITLAEAYPYLTSGTQTDAYSYAQSEFTRQNPFTQGSFPKDPDVVLTRREYVTPVSKTFYESVTSHDASSFLVQQRWPRRRRCWPTAPTACGRYAGRPATGPWLTHCLDELSQHHGQATALPSRQDWATMGPLCGSNPYLGGVNYANARMARHIGHARIAHHRGDSTQEQKAIYRLARTAINRFANGKLIGYLYDEGIVKIAGPANWLALLSTSTAEAGAGQLWTDNWDTGDEDCRDSRRLERNRPAAGP